MKKKRQREGATGVDFEDVELFRKCEEELMNSVLRPNRYSLAFLYTSIGNEPMSQIPPSKIKPRELLFNWHKLYKVHSICKHEGDILILRENSISSLLPIDQKQYTAEF